MTFDIDHFNRIAVVLMCCAMAFLFVMEMLGVFNPRFVTITAIIRFTVPTWLRAMAWGWLGWHFLGWK